MVCVRGLGRGQRMSRWHVGGEVGGAEDGWVVWGGASARLVLVIAELCVGVIPWVAFVLVINSSLSCTGVGRRRSSCVCLLYRVYCYVCVGCTMCVIWVYDLGCSWGFVGPQGDPG